MNWTIGKKQIVILAGSLLVMAGAAFGPSGENVRESCTGAPCRPVPSWLAAVAAVLGTGSTALVVLAVRGARPGHPPTPAPTLASDWITEAHFRSQLVSLNTRLAAEVDSGTRLGDLAAADSAITDRPSFDRICPERGGAAERLRLQAEELRSAASGLQSRPSPYAQEDVR